MFYVATGITPAMVMYLPNIGSAYLGSFFDAKGVTLESVGQLRVWTKCLDQKELGNVLLDEASLKKAARKRLSRSVSRAA